MEYERIYDQINNEYLVFISGLTLLDKSDIIAQSQRTAFYTNILLYLRDNILSEKQSKYLDGEDILPKLYDCYVSNDYDYLDAMNSGGKLLYQYIKEQQTMEM